MAKAPDGSIVVTGQAARGFLDWYTVAFETNGTVRWEAVRDGGLNTDEIPADVLVLPDGTTVVTGKGGPNLPGGYIPGVTAGYSSAGTLLWEAFSPLATVWATALPNGDVCTTGGYDAYLTCWGVSNGVVNPPRPTSVVSRKTHGPTGTFGFLPLTSNAVSMPERRSEQQSPSRVCVSDCSDAERRFGYSRGRHVGHHGGVAEYQSGWKDGNTEPHQRYRCANDCDDLVWSKQRHDHERRYRPYASLVGDTNFNGVVNASDVSQTKSRSGQASTNANFRSDVVVNGTINASDLAMIKSHSGAGTP